MEIKRIREEIEALRQKIESEVSERLDKLAAEVADLKSRLKDTGKKSALIQPEGSIITQDMINRYMERK